MKLHEDKFSFLNIIGLIHEASGIRESDWSGVLPMLTDRKLFLEMLEYKRLEETRRTGSDLADKMFRDFKIFRLGENTGLKEAYEKMQKNYVFDEKDILPFAYIVCQWQKFKKLLEDLD